MGHAAEITDVLTSEGQVSNIVYFDDVTQLHKLLDGLQFPVIKTVEEAAQCFETDSSFVVAVGGVEARRTLDEKLTSVGGNLCSVVSNLACVSGRTLALGIGANVMPFAFLGSQCRIGRCVLLNVGAQVHHNCEVGDYCDIGPGAVIAGGASLSEQVTLGAGAIVLPGVSIGARVRVGAGGVVIEDIDADTVIAGVPARSISRSKN